MRSRQWNGCQWRSRPGESRQVQVHYLGGTRRVQAFTLQAGQCKPDYQQESVGENRPKQAVCQAVGGDATTENVSSLSLDKQRWLAAGTMEALIMETHFGFGTLEWSTWSTPWKPGHCGQHLDGRRTWATRGSCGRYVAKNREGNFLDRQRWHRKPGVSLPVGLPGAQGVPIPWASTTGVGLHGGPKSAERARISP